MKNNKLKSGYKIVDWRYKKKIQIPDQWDTCKLKQLIANIQSGFASGERDEDGIKQLRVNNITDDGNLDLDELLKVPIPKNIETYRIKKNDILFNNTNSNELVGKTAIAAEASDYTFSNHITRLRTTEKIYPYFLFLIFLRYKQREIFVSICNPHVNQSGIIKKDLLNLPIILPPKEEQQKISSILKNVDNYLQKITLQLELTNQLKKGLMQKIFTIGIGKPNTKKVKWLFRTEIKIPEHWNRYVFKEIFSDIIGGTPLKPKDFVDEGFPVLHKGDIKPNNTIEISEINPFCTKQFAEDYKEHIIDKSHLVVTLRDLVPSGPSIGLIAQCNGSYLLAQGAYGFHVDKKKIDPDFLIQLSNSGVYRKYIISQSVGSTQIHVRNPDFLKMEFWFPPLGEQQKISAILRNTDYSLQKLKLIKSNLELLKKGLMQNLLTGKKRVKI